MVGSAQERQAIVCGITGDLDFALAAMLTGFMRHNAGFSGDIVVFHDGLAAEQKARLKQLFPHITFRQFNLTTLRTRLCPDEGMAELNERIARYSPLVFAKFEMFDLLEDYDKCLWLDVDMIIRGSLQTVWDFDCLTWRPLADSAFARRAEVLAPFEGLRRDADTTLPNGGVIGVARAALSAGVDTEALYALTRDLLAQTKVSSLDEIAFYLLAASRKLPIKNLATTFNHPITADDVASAVVQHAIGPDKFWNSAPLVTCFPEWAQNLAPWLAAGGAGYDGPLQLQDVHPGSVEKVLKVARNRAFWESLYTTLRPDLPKNLQVDLRSDRNFLCFNFLGTGALPSLRLLRQPIDRKIGIDLTFADDQEIAPAIFAQLDGTTVPGPAKQKQWHLAKAQGNWRYRAVVPIDTAAQGMAALADAVSRAVTPRRAPEAAHQGQTSPQTD